MSGQASTVLSAIALGDIQVGQEMLTEIFLWLDLFHALFTLWHKNTKKRRIFHCFSKDCFHLQHTNSSQCQKHRRARPVCPNLFGSVEKRQGLCLFL
jgi:hypothetical protein